MRDQCARACTIALATGWLALAGALPAGGSDASAVVERLHGALLRTMQRAETLGYEGRRAALAPVLRDIFDYSFMARLALGRAWKKLEPEQQRRWVETFQEFSLATYASQFDGYSGERFETLGEEPASHDTALVRTRVVRTDDEPIQLDYRLRPSEDGWRIIDVYLDGTVSELARRRSEYTSVLDREGFDGLLAAVQEKIDGYASSVSAPRS